MEKKITIEEFVNSKEKLAVEVNTRKEFYTFVDAMNMLGQTWIDGTKYEHSDYERYGFTGGVCLNNHNEFANRVFYKKYGFKFYNFDEIDFEIKPKEEKLKLENAEPAPKEPPKKEEKLCICAPHYKELWQATHLSNEKHIELLKGATLQHVVHTDYQSNATASFAYILKNGDRLILSISKEEQLFIYQEKVKE